MPQTIFAGSTVIRTKPNYYTMITEKLRGLPWGEAGEQWLDLSAEGNKTPRETIEEGNGHIVETAVDEMVAIHQAYAGLENLQQRFGGVPQLQEVWEAFDRAKPAYPWK